MRQNYVKSLRTVEFSGTMTASTVTVNGVAATRVTLVVGAQTSGSSVSTVSSPSVMVWTPSATATNLTGRAASTTPTSETGTSDREFWITSSPRIYSRIAHGTNGVTLKS